MDIAREKDNLEIKKFNLEDTIDHIKHYLPSQWALKDFIHHNSLHAFQHKKFFEGINEAYEIFGYKVTMNINEYITEYKKGNIDDNVIQKVLEDNFAEKSERELWHTRMFTETQEHNFDSRIGNIRENWKTHLKIDLDAMVYPLLFSTLCNFLDQGISIWQIDSQDKTFLQNLRDIDSNGWISFFRRKRAKLLLQNPDLKVEDLLKILVGENEELYEHYLFDQQFEHQGWSGFVAQVEVNPAMLLSSRKISTSDLMIFECLLEIDALDYKLGEGKWKPIEKYISYQPKALFEDIRETEVFSTAKLWQEAYEWTYYNSVLKGILDNEKSTKIKPKSVFQVIVCIDDRMCSWRRHLEYLAPHCETFGTPGFFSLDMFFQPLDGQYYSKVCPAPITPQYLIKEIAVQKQADSLRKKFGAKLTSSKKHHHTTDIHFSSHSFNSVFGWVSSQIIGLGSAFSLVKAVFFPQESAATSNSFNHMEKNFQLAIENKSGQTEKNLKVGYTKEEMAHRVENTLRSIGLTSHFASIIYIVGHGSTSTNNPYYAGYDCGACSGRAGSVNARAFSMMANDKEVRAILKEKGIDIPDETLFLGGLQDTSQDVVQFFDKDLDISQEKRNEHKANKKIMREALMYNAIERSRRFETIDNRKSMSEIHSSLKRRTVSFFEVRPEYNHATNTLCIVGRRDMTKNLFLDRRAFLNSYDYAQDTDGKYLQQILNAAAPVCGGINLEYYFSKTDNQKLGSGSKLPHNVMGLIGVANGIEGDLRPGLPAQMVEIHDPMRLMIVVEQFPEIILSAIQANPATHEWFKNEWIHLICKYPEKQMVLRYKDDEFIPLNISLGTTDNVSFEQLVKSFLNNRKNIPVKIIN